MDFNELSPAAETLPAPGSFASDLLFAASVAMEASPIGLIGKAINHYVPGLGPILNWGTIGSVVELFTALPAGQIPLGGGFTLETPWSVPEKPYVTGVPGQSRGFQAEAQFAGQRMISWLPIRTHTTGLIDYAVRTVGTGGVPARMLGLTPTSALEMVHPGRVSQIARELSEPETAVSQTKGIPSFVASAILRDRRIPRGFGE